MKTTQVIIEHLIAGIQMLVWVVLLLISIIGTKWIILINIEGYETILLFLALAFVYPFGVIIDNTSDHLLKKHEKNIRLTVPGGSKSMRKLLIMLNDIGVEEQFDYIRTRIRICRSALFNSFLITISSILLTLIQFNQSPFFGKVLICEILIGSGFIYLSFHSWNSLVISFYSKIGKRYSELEKVNNED